MVMISLGIYKAIDDVSVAGSSLPGLRKLLLRISEYHWFRSIARLRSKALLRHPDAGTMVHTRFKRAENHREVERRQVFP